MRELVHTVEKKHKNGGALRVVLVLEVAGPKLELMAERDPVLFHEHLKPLQAAEVRVAHQLHQSAQLARPVPPVRAVHQHVLTILLSLSLANIHVIMTICLSRLLERSL